MTRAVSRRSFLYAPAARDWDIAIDPLTHGPRYHWFGYIGHVRNTPWSAGDPNMVALRASFQDRMPQPGEAADVVGEVRSS